MCVSQQSVEYLEHVIDKNGLHPSPSKVHSIKQTSPPSNVTELKFFWVSILLPQVLP